MSFSSFLSRDPLDRITPPRNTIPVPLMASLTPFHTILPRPNSPAASSSVGASVSSVSFPDLPFAGSSGVAWSMLQKQKKKKRSPTVVAAVGELSADSTTYLVAGAIGVALIGTAFPILFSRKDLWDPISSFSPFFIQFSNYLIQLTISCLNDRACLIYLVLSFRCPECDGAGFVRKSGVRLRANAARKDEAQIVCARCNGLGKLNQIDK